MADKKIVLDIHAGSSTALDRVFALDLDSLHLKL